MRQAPQESEKGVPARKILKELRETQNLRQKELIEIESAAFLAE